MKDGNQLLENPEMKKAMKETMKGINKKIEKDDCKVEGPCKEQEDCCDPITCVKGKCEMFHF